VRATHRLASRGRGNRDRGSDAQKAHRLPGESQDPWHHRLELLERSYGLPNDDRLVRRNDGPRLSPGVRAVSVFPAIVDPELFRAAQARLAMRNRHPRSERALPQLFVGLWYGGQAIPRKPHHSSGERTNRRCRCRRAAGRAGSGALCGPIDDGADRRSRAPASGFPLSAVPTMPDRRSVIRAESRPVWPPPVRCRFVTIPGSREARRFPALPPFRPAS
jgi:hypothetical protein